jgi:hypothetical protein
MNNNQIKTLDIFPTRVYLIQLDQLQLHYESWRKFIQEMRASEIKPRGKAIVVPGMPPLTKEAIQISIL